MYSLPLFRWNYDTQVHFIASDTWWGKFASTLLIKRKYIRSFSSVSWRIFREAGKTMLLWQQHCWHDHVSQMCPCFATCTTSVADTNFVSMQCTTMLSRFATGGQHRRTLLLPQCCSPNFCDHLPSAIAVSSARPNLMKWMMPKLIQQQALLSPGFPRYTTDKSSPCIPLYRHSRKPCHRLHTYGFGQQVRLSLFFVVANLHSEMQSQFIKWHTWLIL